MNALSIVCYMDLLNLNVLVNEKYTQSCTIR